jgi:carbamoyltransferase
MLICGIKISHDSGVAVIEEDRLIFSVEIEKLANNRRYSTLGDLCRVEQILRSEGLDPEDVDQFVVDGWVGDDGLEGTEPAVLAVTDGGVAKKVRVAPYQDTPGNADPLRRYVFDDHRFASRHGGYVSYHHASNHLIGAYLASPFAARAEDALVLVWDGGTVPRLYEVKSANRSVFPIAALMPLTGNSFGDFSWQFGPFRRPTDGLTADEIWEYRLSIAGKAMAYAALGTVEESAFSLFDELIGAFPSAAHGNAKVLGEKIASNRDELFQGMSDADLIATFQAYLGNVLLARMTDLVTHGKGKWRPAEGMRASSQPNLVLSGGCALNIKWNTLLRNSGLFADVWVPPFPNDSGAAIGTAACEMFRVAGHSALRWDVYSGPRLSAGALPSGWTVSACAEQELAEILHREPDPVTVLSGRAEIGPRALGNRSILAAATDPGMKDMLNRIKGRAGYRPVAPICLADRAAEVFAPGGVDPYMLFEHRLRPGWSERVPAVIHLDGTARLQTIERAGSTAISRILTAYERLSGIPVLCNTSANHNGSGFFPDVASAADWGGTRRIWSDGRLFTKAP